MRFWEVFDFWWLCGIGFFVLWHRERFGFSSLIRDSVVLFFERSTVASSFFENFSKIRSRGEGTLSRGGVKHWHTTSSKLTRKGSHQRVRDLAETLGSVFRHRIMKRNSRSLFQ